VPLNKDLRLALAALKTEADESERPSPYVITGERGEKTSSCAVVNMFASGDRTPEFTGASSHS
jgi:hypothetical protein